MSASRIPSRGTGQNTTGSLCKKRDSSLESGEHYRDKLMKLKGEEE
jgi:hypothetical protein